MNAFAARGQFKVRPIGWLAALLVLGWGVFAHAQPQSLLDYAAVVGVADDPRVPNVGTPRFGGTLHVAEERGLSSFDGHLISGGATIEVNITFAEGLFALDASGTAVPQLVDTYVVSDDGLRYTLTLRHGVPFHNGQEMTTDDVIASLERWLNGPLGSGVADNIAGLAAVDAYTFEILLNEPMLFLPYTLSVPQSGSAWIYPREQVEAAGLDDIGIPDGTGPYRILEYREGEYLRFGRFDEYAGRAEPPSAFAGGRVAYVDEIVLHYIADESVRVAGVQTGQYHVAKGVNRDLFSTFENHPEVRTSVHVGGLTVANMNKRAGPFVDQRVRQAFALAINVRDVVAAAAGYPEFARLDSSLVAEGDPWHTTVGMEQYLAYDPDRARELLAEAGYAGEPIRWVVVPEVQQHYTAALVSQPMLEAVGFNIELRTMDQASLYTVRLDENLWEIFSTNYAPRPDPSTLTLFQSSHVSWWDSDEKNRLIAALQSETDFDVRYPLWEELHAHFWDYVPMFKFQTQGTLNLERHEYSGLWRLHQHYHINTWLNE